MANVESTARTNYFKVKDDKEFLGWLEEFGDVEAIKEDKGWVLLFRGEGGVPSFVSVEPNDEGEGYDELFEHEKEVDFIGELAAFLEDGEVAVVEEVGREKFRYVYGYAIAINNKGQTVSVNIDSIYELAKEAGLGNNISVAAY